MSEQSKDGHYQSMWLRIVESFDKDDTANQFLREDGEGGFSAGVYRMAREIDRLRIKCGEPPHREPDWEAREEEQIDAEIIAELRSARTTQGA